MSKGTAKLSLLLAVSYKSLLSNGLPISFGNGASRVERHLLFSSESSNAVAQRGFRKIANVYGRNSTDCPIPIHTLVYGTETDCVVRAPGGHRRTLQDGNPENAISNKGELERSDLSLAIVVFNGRRAREDI